MQEKALNADGVTAAQIFAQTAFSCSGVGERTMTIQAQILPVPMAPV